MDSMKVIINLDWYGPTQIWRCLQSTNTQTRQLSSLELPAEIATAQGRVRCGSAALPALGGELPPLPTPRADTSSRGYILPEYPPCTRLAQPIQENGNTVEGLVVFFSHMDETPYISCICCMRDA